MWLFLPRSLYVFNAVGLAEPWNSINLPATVSSSCTTQTTVIVLVAISEVFFEGGSWTWSWGFGLWAQSSVQHSERKGKGALALFTACGQLCQVKYIHPIWDGLPWNLVNASEVLKPWILPLSLSPVSGLVAFILRRLCFTVITFRWHPLDSVCLLFFF